MYEGYVITALKFDGSRQMALNNNGSNTHRTEAAAQAQLDSIVKHTDPETVKQTLGTELRIDPVPCYDNGDSTKTVF